MEIIEDDEIGLSIFRKKDCPDFSWMKAGCAEGEVFICFHKFEPRRR